MSAANRRRAKNPGTLRIKKRVSGKKNLDFPGDMVYNLKLGIT